MTMKTSKQIFLIGLFSMIPFWAAGQEGPFRQTGKASFYADAFEGKKTASGEEYYHEKLTAAHKKLPMGTIVKVTNLENEQTVAVRINDRGPHKPGRIIDLSRSAARRLDMLSRGTARVKIEVIKRPGEPFFGEEKKKEEPAGRYYSLNLSRIQPQGKGIQLGSFSRLSSLAAARDKVPQNLKNQLHVEIVETDRGELYRLICGFFQNQQSLQANWQKLKQPFPKSFIVSPE
jgi:rare lipoprotein A